MKRTKKSAKNTISVMENVPSEKYLTFFIDRQTYALPTSQVVEIIRLQPITLMPNLPDYVKGVINLRGKIVPLIDMRLKFLKDPIPYDNLTSIIIVENGDMTAGLIVDSVKDVRDIAKSQIFDAPKYKRSVGDRYVCAIASLEKVSAMVLDINRILSDRGAESQPGRTAADQLLKTAAE
ncbi:Chemotaxis protein CheW [Caprobacter fermentans]|uniref:Chemotaxis protein CheW n=1 Tax=Caproicibacter fermentans TaxID=2576756 RepID=A0A6N8HVF4_9FIRM|nr:chemotaxis protein CheW [Caproicibacter fermentans]MVB09766.1 Chemotaxis protein CheW [Caproicibacter fermentans]QNK42352.1 purine-binding chemotaxis protein CheW [Caproicibacter fermentans]